jgi:AcrR family transcriptional regulator
MTKREPNARGTGDQLRAQLVAAASELLLTTQLIALPSLRAVARACSVSPAAVYLHFESQQALVLAVIDAQVGELREAIRAATERVAPENAAAAFAEAYVDWGLEHPGAYQLLFESAEQLGIQHRDDDEGWNLMRDAATMMREVLGVDERSADILAFRTWTAIHGLVSLRLHKPDAPWPTTIRDDVAHILAGLETHALPTANTTV